jgi:glycosyltransferase involved in cell wall biosynthesis
VKSIAFVLNYPLQNQIDVGHLDVLMVMFRNALKLFDEVHVLSPRDNRKYDLGKRIFVHSLPSTHKALAYVSPFADLAFLVRLIRRKNVKVIRAMAVSSGAVVVAASKITGVPCVVSVHTDRDKVNEVLPDPVLKKAVLDRLEPWVLRNTRIVPVVTEYISGYARRKGAKNVVMHHNFVDTKAFKPLGRKARKPVVFFAGRLDAPKGVERLVRLAPRIHAEVRIAGSGPDEAKLKQMARGMKNVVFLGSLKHEKELPRELASAWVFASPWMSGFTLIESLACGTPIVGTDVEWTKEIVTQKTGVLTRDGDDEAFVRAINSLLKDKKRRAAMGKAGRSLVEKEFSRESYEKRELAIYSHLLPKRK